MTVAELIELLRLMPDTAHVFVRRPTNRQDLRRELPPDRTEYSRGRVLIRLDE